MRPTTKSKYLQSIYAELRSVLGASAAAGDILRLALLICDTADDEEEDLPPIRAGHSLVWSAVDHAMADGGWSVMRFETQRGLKLVDDYEPGVISVRRRADNLAGRVLWPRVTKMD